MAISATVDPPPRRGRCGSVPAACLRSLAGARRSSRVLTAALTGRPIRHEAWSRWSRRGDSNPEPSAYKNSGRGRSGWSLLVRLIETLSALHAVSVADGVSGTASGTDCLQWPDGVRCPTLAPRRSDECARWRTPRHTWDIPPELLLVRGSLGYCGEEVWYPTRGGEDVGVAGQDGADVVEFGA